MIKFKKILSLFPNLAFRNISKVKQNHNIETIIKFQPLSPKIMDIVSTYFYSVLTLFPNT